MLTGCIMISPNCIAQAKRLAKKSKVFYGNIGKGAVLSTYSGKIKSTGVSRTSGRIQKIEKKIGEVLFSLHAEMDALLNYDGAGDKYLVLYICGYKKNGRPVTCKPCDKCLKFISRFPVSAIVYEDNNSITIMRRDNNGHFN